MNFKIGTKIICIDENFGDRMKVEETLGVKFPKLDKIYTIRGFDYSFESIIGLYLEEIRNPKLRYFEGISEIAFNSVRFREVTDADELLKEIMKEPELLFSEMQEYVQHEYKQRQLKEK